MNIRTRIASTSNAACIPECPSCGRCCARNAGCSGLQEVKLVGRVFANCAADDSEEDQQETACYEDERDDGEDGSCGVVRGGVFQVGVGEVRLLGDISAVVYWRLV